MRRDLVFYMLLFCVFFFLFVFFFFFIFFLFFFFQAEDGIRDHCVTGVQTCALPILLQINILIVSWHIICIAESVWMLVQSSRSKLAFIDQVIMITARFKKICSDSYPLLKKYRTAIQMSKYQNVSIQTGRFMNNHFWIIAVVLGSCQYNIHTLNLAHFTYT